MTTAESVRRSNVPGPDGGIILTPSTGKVAGRIALIAAGDVPGGRDDKRIVGFGMALSCVLVRPPVSSSSESCKAVLGSAGPSLVSSNANSPSLWVGGDPSYVLFLDNEGGGPRLPGPLFPRPPPKVPLPRGPADVPEKCLLPGPPSPPLSPNAAFGGGAELSSSSKDLIKSS